MEAGAALGPSMEQGSLRRQQSPSLNSGQGASSINRVHPLPPQPGRTWAGGDQLPPFPPPSFQGIGISPHTAQGAGGWRGITRVVVHQVVQAGEGEPGRDVKPSVVQPVDAVVSHRGPGSALATAHRQGIAACQAHGKGHSAGLSQAPVLLSPAACCILTHCRDSTILQKQQASPFSPQALWLQASLCQPHAMSTFKTTSVTGNGWDNG